MNKLPFWFLICFFLFNSCHRKEDAAPKNEFKVKKNNVDWVGILLNNNYSDSLFGFYIGVKNKEGFLREDIEMYNIPKKAGKYPLIFSKWDRSQIICAYSTSQDDGDVGCDIYYVYPGDSLTNFIQVTDIVNNTATGKFNGTFLREKDSHGNVCDPSKPDTIRFTNGSFKINFEKKY